LLRVSPPLQDHPRLDAELAQHGRHDAALLGDQRVQQVLGLDLGILALLGQALRRADGLLRLFR
jgi:hypothetical protein